VPGQAVLIGVKGDARGLGEVRPINATHTNWIQLPIATNAAVTAGDALVFSTTTWFDESSDQMYIDSYAIGHGTADHYQTIGGVPSFGVSGTGVGEKPKLDFEVAVQDHQEVAVGDRSSFTQAQSPKGGEPAFNRSMGMVHIGDADSSTRTVIKCTDIAINPNVSFEPDPAPHGVNGQSGFTRMAGVPTGEATLLIDEDFGLLADFEAGTAKHIIVQLGTAATKTIAFEFPSAYLDAKPIPTDVGNLKGIRIVWHGTRDESKSEDMRKSPLLIHQL
jgi:hypothetical protein